MYALIFLLLRAFVRHPRGVACSVQQFPYVELRVKQLKLDQWLERPAQPHKRIEWERAQWDWTREAMNEFLL